MHIPSIAALNTGSDYHLLDHIAPISALLNIPLIVTEEKNFSLAKSCYPHVDVELQEDLEFRIKQLALRFDALIECKYWKPHLKQLFSNFHKKKMNLIFCPHGQSDKGFSAPLLAPYAQQDIVLLYGKLLIEMLKQLNIWPAINRFAVIGDYRLAHYQKHKAFYDALADREIFSRLPQNHLTFLYAPTWQDVDCSSSFFDWGKILVSQLPSDWNLIIKVHPLLEQRNPARYYPMLRHLDNHLNVLLVSDFPPIHPILDRVNGYLGDFSSIGYDFLSYQRPMFFLPHPTLPQGRLHRSGFLVDPKTPIFSFIEKHLFPVFSKEQKLLYRFAFGDLRTEETIRKSIRLLLSAQSGQDKNDSKILEKRSCWKGFDFIRKTSLLEGKD